MIAFSLIPFFRSFHIMIQLDFSLSLKKKDCLFTFLLSIGDGRHHENEGRHYQWFIGKTDQRITLVHLELFF